MCAVHLIGHPSKFMHGTNVLTLKGRNKDSVDIIRTLVRVTNGMDEYEKVHEELVTLLQPGERIYTSASRRDVGKAIRIFRERQLEAEYTDVASFYKRLPERWASSLMSPTCQIYKLWLFDADSVEEYNNIKLDIRNTANDLGLIVPPIYYDYATKNGRHIVVRPFDISELPERSVKCLISKNPVLLSAYRDR